MDIEAEVKKALRGFRQSFKHFWPMDEHEIDIMDNDLAHSICQLFPKTADNPDGASIKSPEATPTEGGLLTEKGVKLAIGHIINDFGCDLGLAIHHNRERPDIITVIEQVYAKTASIMDARCADEKVGFAASVYDEAICMARVECQQRVGGIKRKIEKNDMGADFIDAIDGPDLEIHSFPTGFLKALWKEEGV